MNAPGSSAEPGQHYPQHPQHPQQPHAAGESAPGRGKTVTTACERCRRRKIRCDGETPCATCRRFRISCVRIQKSDTHALETRVRQLEAQIAELTAGLSSAQGQDLHVPTSSRTWLPDIRLMTDFGSTGPAIAIDQAFTQFPGSGSSPLEVPSIQVVDYADSSSPVSPVSLSPSPSLRQMAPIFPKPAPESLETGLRPSCTGAAVSPTTTLASPSPNSTSMPYLSPRSVPGPPRSRSSSLSSLNLDCDWSPISGDLSVSGLTEADLGTSMFDVVSSPPEPPAPWTPTRFEAETLLDKFFDRTRGLRIPLDRSKLFEFLDIINPPQTPSGGCEPSCPVSMARFHVFMAMAIGLRMETESRATMIHMLHNCYRLALEEARAPFFWTQPFGLEAAMLIMIFAQVSRQDT
ncbi:Zn(II)2Cys6 transcription factor domain-containing protein [Aspergillus lucknowensis]|uniref:Zn(2)-C6 fungal-type domain-containing protein n=1 Tax=Aspergillus lucknowensis TaxID=176173 RepID=A0ABR4LX42_9EURO